MNWQILTEFPTPDVRRKWDEFLADADYPTHYVTPNFFIDPFIRGGERFAILCLEKDGAIVAVLTGIDAGRKVFSGLATRPQLAFRKNVNKQKAVEALVRALMEKGGGDLELTRVHSWDRVDELDAYGFRRESDSESNSVIMLDLSVGADEVFKGFSQTRRNELRKASKQNAVEIGELGSEDELKQLHDIHVAWNSRKGNRPDTFEDLRLAASQADNRKIFVAKHAGKVIAGSYYRFCRGGIAEYAANNSLPEYQKFRPNDLLGWHAIQWACHEGFPLFSMGGSHLFLRRFGGRSWPTYCYSLDATFLKRHEKRERLQSMASTIYKSLPDTARNRIKQFMG